MMYLRLRALLLLLCLGMPTGANATQQANSQQGYIEMADGVGLRYTVLLPEGPGPFPVLLQYQGYAAGTSPGDNGLFLISDPMRLKGVAILGVSVRGTGCSEGSFVLFEDQWIADGLEILRWAAIQPWSNGDIAMAGASFPGITQLMVAPFREPALKALLPSAAITDLYRDVSYPGGIFNTSFAAFFTAAQKQNGTVDAPFEVAEEGDARCAAALATQNDPENIVFLMGKSNPWADRSIYERFVPEGSIKRIDVPTLITHAWQDEQLSPRVTVDYEQLNPDKTWFVFSNGPHLFGLDSLYLQATSISFLQHFLLHEDNGFQTTPKVQILHDYAPTKKAAWVTTHEGWPVATAIAELFLTPAGALDTIPAPEAAALSYNYPQPAPSMISSGNPTYERDIPPGGAVTFTTPALSHDLEILGSIRLDLWLSSTASDTDLQVSLTEVRPDRKEQYVQRGWLRASHRKLDPVRSRANLPFHTHLEKDSLPLTPGEATPLSIEIWAVGYVFRAGSSLRISIEAPVGTTGFRQLDYDPTAATNTVHVGGATPSRLTLPVVPGGAAEIGYAVCTAIASQPCRNDPGTVPSGTLSVPEAQMIPGSNLGTNTRLFGGVLDWLSLFSMFALALWKRSGAAYERHR